MFDMYETAFTMQEKKQILGFLGVSVSLTGILVLTGTVWWAFLFNDGFFAVTIMRFNEGLLEFVVLPVVCVLCVYGVFRYYKDILCGGVLL